MRKPITETLADLEREGVLTPEQRATVERRLEAALARKHDGGGRFVSILAALGAVLVGAGFLYLVGYNWEKLSKVAKLAIVFGTWLGVHYAGFRLSESPGRYPRIGRALTVIGVLCFGGAIGVVGQIYNLSSEYPNWALAWWGLSVPFALITRSRAILLVVIVLFLIWILWHTGVYVDRFDRHVDQEYFAAFALVGAGVAALFSALAQFADGGPWDRFRPILAHLARPAAIGAAYALSFASMWRGSDSSSGWLWGGWDRHEGLRAHTFLPFGALAVAAVLVIVASSMTATRAKRITEPLVFLGFGALLAVNLFLGPHWIYLLANAALLAGIVALVWFGIRRGMPGDVNWGIATFVLCLVTRYVEYLWDKLGGAYAFIGIGLLLLGAGFVLERRRREWIALSAGRTT